MNNKKLDFLKNVENPKLMETIKILRAGDEKPFNIALMTAKFLCPAVLDVVETKQNGEVHQGVKMNLFNLNANNGCKYLMAFTDYNEMLKWKDEETDQAVVMAIPQYTSIMEAPNNHFDGFVINPFSDNIVIRREYLIKLKENLRLVRKPIILDAEETIMEDSDAFPKGLIPAVIDYFNQSKDVQKAYLIAMTKEEEQDYLMVVETTENPKYLFPCINNVCEQYLNDKKLNIVPAGTPLAKAAILGMDPFYINKKKD